VLPWISSPAKELVHAFYGRDLLKSRAILKRILVTMVAMAAFSRDRDRIDTGSGGIVDRAVLRRRVAALALSGRHRYISADFPEISGRLRWEPPT
jgi:hypothetical protein